MWPYTSEEQSFLSPREAPELPSRSVAALLRPVAIIKRIYLAWLQYREFEAALANYRAMPEQELNERGLTRADIVRLAYEEAETRIEAGQVKRRAPGNALRPAGTPKPAPSGRPATA
jgi:hypothetical protein